MRKALLLILIMITITSTVYADASDWKFKKEILNKNSDIERSQTGYKEFFLDSDIYRESKEDLSDIRIINQEGEFIPYYIESEKDDLNIIKRNSYDGENILNFYKEKKYYTDFELISDKSIDKDFLTNKLVFNINNRGNFAKDIKVYGSYDNVEWTHIKDDNIYSVSGGSYKAEVAFNNTFKYIYYRIVIIDNIEDIQIGDLTALNIETNYFKDNYTSTIDIDYDEVHENQETILYIKNDNKLKVYGLQIETNDIFHRQFTLYGEEYMDGGIISDKNRNINIYPNYINDEDLRLVITNKDDKPITINNISIDFMVDKLVFEANENDKYYLVYGNENAYKPNYDIIHKKDSILNIDGVYLSDDFIQNEFEEPKNINNKAILNSVIIVISISLMFLIIKNIKAKE